jgi:Bacterial archaeo-eukaryotic release factor family 7
LLRPDGLVYILALSQNQARLLHGTRHTVRAVDLTHVPRNRADALRFDEKE